MHRLILSLVLALALPHEGFAKVFRYASQIDPGTMDPHGIASLYNTRVVSQIYEVLVGRDEQFRIDPRLALSWSLVEPKVWRFKLRPGVKFHDGTPFTADDVVFSVERALAPTSQQKQTLPNVTGARKVDALTVDILTSQPTPTLPLALTNLRIMSKAWCVLHHIEKPLNFNAKEETFATRNTNGTGPFMLKSWDADVKTVLVANPAYWGQHGNVTEAQFLVVGSGATRLSGLVSGELDFVVDAGVQDVERLSRTPGIKIEQGEGLGAQYLSFDFAHATLQHGDAGGTNPFRNIKVREAMRLAIDLGAIQSKVMRNLSTIGRAIYSPKVDGWDARFAVPAPYDPERARALLKEAGYPNGFSVALDCSSQAPADAVGQAVAGMLARVGIRVAYQPVPFNVLLPKVTGHESSLYVIGWTTFTADAEGVLVPLAHTPSAPGTGDFNFGGYSNANVDSLIDRARVELDPVKRRALLIDAMAALDADIAFIPLVYRRVVWAMRKNVHTPILPNDVVDLRFVDID
ncbi:MAG TPA: ABC transporter substrate-binding protein [Usitatibacter sp.]